MSNHYECNSSAELELLWPCSTFLLLPILTAGWEPFSTRLMMAELVLSLASLLADLQCIREYQKSASEKGGTPYFKLECLAKDGQWYWIGELIFRGLSRLLSTGEGETGREVWKRPLATDGDGVPDAPLIMGRKTSRSGQTKYLRQKVGISYSPVGMAEWGNSEGELDDTDWPERTDGEERQLSAIVGHGLNDEKGSQKRFQFSCQWTNDTEAWEDEHEV
ncbi:hypothetical protein CCM_03084 [Cordyceps militaris CM01]|uniref:Uncharacterized protein n=1 Tax=Cordyceps militaris (strain CM01) TaxID=983644 RepID=G3J8T0_CORMM|nr:uncharacterized protein CCM_03084 [Cordyceps militaris CM01]EGX94813.1 hypothetical protein CCM_03084 [Cordyceps militaris CM01]